jgi:signal transduction histidine kinase
LPGLRGALLIWGCGVFGSAATHDRGDEVAYETAAVIRSDRRRGGGKPPSSRPRAFLRRVLSPLVALGLPGAERSPVLGQPGAMDSYLPLPSFSSAGQTMRGMYVAVLVTAVASAAATAALALVPQLHLAYPWQAENLALQTAGSMIALLACFMILGRLRRRTRLNELMLACALAVLALSDLFFVIVPIVAGWAPDDLTVWAAPTARSLGAILFFLAAFVPNLRLRRFGLVLGAGAGGVTIALLLTTVLVRTFARRLPPQVIAYLAPESSARPDLHIHLAELALELAVAVLYGVAVAGFLRRCRRLGDEFFGWLAIAAVLAAISHINYLLYPAINSQSLYAGDAFRFAFYVVLLLGSMREIWSYWRALSHAAVLEERQRISCNLHDGVAQELAYLARNLDSLEGEADEESLARLRGSVERAQLESRRAISALAAPSGQPFEIALAEAVTEVAERYHVDLDLDFTSDVWLSPARREALVRIACEAVTNAARHSGAGRISLGMERDGSRVRLWISDKGRGFDTGAPGGGFGLTSMRERARSVGGELLVFSAPGHGSEVEVAV